MFVSPYLRKYLLTVNKLFSQYMYENDYVYKDLGDTEENDDKPKVATSFVIDFLHEP